MEVLYLAKGGGGGGHASGGARSSVSSSRSSTSSKSTSTSKSSGTKTTTKTTTTKTKAGGKITTKDGKTIQTSSKKPSNTKFKNEKGIVGQDNYQPRFTNGYVAPAGSVVYYPQHSALDYLPWIYLFSQNNSPRNDSVATVQPDGKEVIAKPVQQGTDGMAVFNWILLFLMAAAVIGGVSWIVLKLTNRKKG